MQPRALLFLVLLEVTACIHEPECGCPDRLPAAILHVVDATTSMPIDAPIFTEAGTTLSAVCSDQTFGSNAVCRAWTILLVGHHDVTISAAGRIAQTITVDLAPGGPGCCSVGQQVEDTVMLAAP